jgi:UDP-N-acetylglucosamine 2-epimerase
LKIVTIVGARPQFIKAAVVSRAFREHRPAVREVLSLPMHPWLTEQERVVACVARPL